MPSLSPIDEQRLGRQPGVLEDHRDELVAGPGRAPAGPAELAVLEVAEGVGREQPVALEELAQDARGR